MSSYGTVAARRFQAGIVALVVLALHSVVNATARHVLGISSVKLLPGISLRVVENSSGPFGLGPVWASLLAGAAVLGALVLFRSRIPPLALGFILGGGIANLAERILTGKTTDILILADITALNIADAAILLGLALLLWRWKTFPRV